MNNVNDFLFTFCFVLMTVLFFFGALPSQNPKIPQEYLLVAGGIIGLGLLFARKNSIDRENDSNK